MYVKASTWGYDCNIDWHDVKCHVSVIILSEKCKIGNWTGEGGGGGQVKWKIIIGQLLY